MTVEAPPRMAEYTKINTIWKRDERGREGRTDHGEDQDAGLPVSAKRPAVATAATDHVVHSREAMTTNEGPTAVGAAAPRLGTSVPKIDLAAPKNGRPTADQQERAKWRANERADAAEAEVTRLREAIATALDQHAHGKPFEARVTLFLALSAQPTPGAARQPEETTR